MKDAPALGSKIRGLRRQRRLTQAELARRLGISGSYLNLIEHNQRAVTAPLLIKLAGEFDLDFRDFAADEDERVAADLLEAFADPMFEEQDINSADVRELAAASPALARSVLALYQQYRHATSTAHQLANRVYADQEGNEIDHVTLPSEEVTDFMQRRDNYFDDLERSALDLRASAAMTGDGALSSLSHWLAGQGITVEVGSDSGHVLRRYDARSRKLFLSDVLPPASRAFQLATQIGLLPPFREAIDNYARDPSLTSDSSRTLCRIVLANYFAAAVIMPYEEFLAATQRVHYDVQLLGHRFASSFEQVCHRLSTLRRPGLAGVPMHMLRVDLAGNISKRFTASGIRFARFSGGCPRWNVFSAFQTPGMIRVQISRMPGGDTYFCIARTVSREAVGFHSFQTVRAVGLGCRIEDAKALVYADGYDLAHPDPVVEVGVTCRLCDRADCDQRVLPSLRHPMRLVEHVRRPSLYSPHDEN